MRKKKERRERERKVNEEEERKNEQKKWGERKKNEKREREGVSLTVYISHCYWLRLGPAGQGQRLADRSSNAPAAATRVEVLRLPQPTRVGAVQGHHAPRLGAQGRSLPTPREQPPWAELRAKLARSH